MNKLSVMLWIGFVAGAQTPNIIVPGARNAANNIPPGNPGSGVAPGSRFVIQGSGFGPQAEAANEAFPLATQFGDISVNVAIGGASVDAYILSVSDSRVVAMLPSSTPTGDGTVTLSYQGNSATTSIKVVPRTFGIFTHSGDGKGPAKARSAADQSDITFYQPAAPGRQIVLRGTGLGAAQGDEASGPVPQDIDASVTVLVGGVPANVIAKVRAGGVAGMDDITIEIPAGVQGCYVPVAAQTENGASNFAMIAVSNSGGACQDPGGLSPAESDKLRGGSGLSLGLISLSRNVVSVGPASSFADIGSATFARYKPETFSMSLRFGFTPPAGACTVYQVESAQPQNPDPSIETAIDAGSPLVLNGPKGTRQIQPNAPATKLGEGVLLPPIPGLPVFLSNSFLEPGAYSITNGAGGADVGPFNVSFNVGPAIAWKGDNATVTAIPRAQDYAVEWTGGGDNDNVTILGISVPASAAGPAMFLCTARAADHRFVVPAAILSALPPSGSAEAGGTLSVSSSPAGDGLRFQASGLDFGTVVVSSGVTRAASYQ